MASKMVTKIVENIITNGDALESRVTWGDAPMLHEVVDKALTMASEVSRDKEIFSVVAVSENKESQLGYATGRENDIRAYFAADGRDIEVRPIKIVDVPAGYDAHRANIIAKRDRLQAEVDELNRRLEEKDIH